MDFVTIYEKFGLPAAFLSIMVWLYIKSDDKFTQERVEHRKEREDWRNSQQGLQRDTNSALKGLTEAISKMKKD